MNFFITATDTNVGKTFVGARLVSALGGSVAYFKPFQSGVEDGVLSDVETVSKLNPDVAIKNSYVTKTPATPALSAEIEDVEISLQKVVEDYKALEAQYGRVIVEGSGGLFVPAGNSSNDACGGFLMSDVILALQLPVIIVARPDLGTINHTLLTLFAAEKLGIKILAVVISNYPNGSKDPVITTAKTYIEQFSSVRVFELFKDSNEFAPELLSVLK